MNRQEQLHQLAEQVRTRAAALDAARLESLRHHKRAVAALMALGEPLATAAQQLTRQEYQLWIRNLPLQPTAISATLRAYELKPQVERADLDGHDVGRLLRTIGIVPPRRGKVSKV